MLTRTMDGRFVVATSPSASIAVAATSPRTRSGRPAQRKARADSFTTAYPRPEDLFHDEWPSKWHPPLWVPILHPPARVLPPNEPLVTCFSPGKHAVGFRYSMQHLWQRFNRRDKSALGVTDNRVVGR